MKNENTSDNKYIKSLWDIFECNEILNQKNKDKK
jgi:hypothetical protein